MSTPEPRSHLAALDGVRAVAAMSVLLTHVGFATGAVESTVAGALTARLDIGVALFFSLSGFLMLRPWIAVALDDPADSSPLPHTGRYALKRAGRILPAYWVVAAVVLLVEHFRIYRPDLRSSLRVGLDDVLSHLVVGQGLTGRYFSTFSQTWSLTTEITFYIAVPALGALLVHRSRRRAGRATRVNAIETWCALTIIGGVAVAAYCASDLPGGTSTVGTSLLGHMAWFAGGVWVCVRRERHGADLVTSRPVGERLGFAAVLLMLAASPLGGNLLFESPSPWQAGVRELLYTVVAMLVVAAAATDAPQSAALRVLSSQPLRWIGTRSYALFLWHLPILYGVMTMLDLDLFEGSFVLIAAITLGVSLLVADLSWRFIERPVLNRVHRRGQRGDEQAEQEQAEPLREAGRPGPDA